MRETLGVGDQHDISGDDVCGGAGGVVLHHALTVRNGRKTALNLNQNLQHRDGAEKYDLE